MTVRDHVDQLLAVGITTPIFPLLGLLLGWWGSYFAFPNASVMSTACIGIVIGLLIDLVFWRRIVNLFSYSFRSLLAVYLFYSIGVFGFFMGVPVFNVVVGIVAGYVAGRRLLDESDRTKREAMVITILFTTSVTLLLLCVASAILALRDPYTASNLKGMLALSFLPTPIMIGGLIFAGGLLLLLFQEARTYISVRMGMTPQKNNREE